jgi:hypothetical protein
MSKPNLLGFSTSIGFYRNHRVQQFTHNLAGVVRRKIPFSKIGPMLFQTVMAYAAENQIDGDFSGYDARSWANIFVLNNVEVSASEAVSIKKELQRAGLLDGDKIRSWKKYNRHLADYEGIVNSRRRAGKLSAKKREMQARAEVENGELHYLPPLQIPEKTAPKDGDFWRQKKQLELVEQQLAGCHDAEERKELRALKRELQSKLTGVKSKSAAPPPPIAPSKPARKMSDGEWQRVCLANAHQLMADGAEDSLTESMARALLSAGEELPPRVAAKFAALVHNNPVPG